MKKLVITFIIITFYGALLAQNVQYQILSNTPPQSSKLNLNLELVQIEVIPKALDASSMNIGLWGHYEIIPRTLAAQLMVRRSIFAFGRLGEKQFPPHLQIEVGAFFHLKNFTKESRTKVSLKKEYSGNTYSTNFRGESTYSYTTTETYIMVPSKKNKSIMLRGGLYLKNNGVNLRFVNDDWVLLGNPEFAKLSSAGLYLGVNLRTLTSIFIDSEQYGVQFNSIGKDLYFDITILPVNKFTDLQGNNITKNVQDFIKGGPIGFKVGYKLFQIDPKMATGKRFGLTGTFELGARPYTGFFINAGIGMAILKK